MEPVRTIKSEVAPGIFQSRWGYHAISYEHFRLLKQLHKHYVRARTLFAEYRRWERKLPKNRVLRKWKRNELGQKIGCEIIGPKPDPRQRCPAYQEVFPTDPRRHLLYGMGIVEAYQNARRPAASPEGVPVHTSLMTKEWCRMILRRLEMS